MGMSIERAQSIIQAARRNIAYFQEVNKQEKTGMSIDKAIPKIQFVRNALNDDMEIAKAYDLAIETMRKYQKIVQIYQKWNRNYDIQTSSAWTEVIEVLEDGNDD